MLEAVIPAVWSAVHGWFTPAVLFVVLNIVIGTIAVTSKVAASAASGGEVEGGGGGDWAGGGGGERRGLSRVPSMALDRLRSFNLSSRFVASAPEPPVDGVMDLGLHGEAEAEATVEAAVKEVGEIECEEHAHMERSRSEAAAEAEVPRLPARLRKSASDRSAFAHFEAEKAAAAAKEEEETVAAVEARRPATTREAPRVWPGVADDDGDSEPESGDEAADAEDDAGAAGEVDARADDFLNKFRHQLKLQRIDSYLRHRDMLRRSHAAAAAVGSD